MKNAYYKNATELETLPNIDINIKCGNSLVSRFAIDADLKKALKKSKWTVDSYRIAVDTYRNAENKEQKREMEKLITTIKSDFRSEISSNTKQQKDLDKLSNQFHNKYVVDQLFDRRLNKEQSKDKIELEKSINKLKEEIEDIKANKIYENAFEWRFEFPEVLNDDGDFVGFDVVIANPPYVQHRELAQFSIFFKQYYNVYSGTADLSSYFFEKMTKILEPNGIICVINSNKFFNAEYGAPLRKYLSNYNIISIINFEQVPIFEEALVSSAIITFSKQKRNQSFEYVKYFKESVLTLQNSQEINLRKKIIDQAFLNSKNWLFNDINSDNIVNKIQLKGTIIAEIPDIQIKRGLTTGYDDAFLINKSTYEQIGANDSNINKIVKKVLKGQNIRRYEIKFNDLWIINSHNGVKGKDMAIDVEKDYPSIFEHLQLVNTKSEYKVESRSDKGRHWTNLRSCAFINDFSKPKIVWGLISGNWSFAIDYDGYFLTSASFFLISDKLDIKFLIALFNSRLYRYYFIQVGEYTAGGAFVLKKASIEKFVIPAVDDVNISSLIMLVENIQFLKKAKEDTTDLENQIDQVIYQLYELTEEEIKIVEGT